MPLPALQEAHKTTLGEILPTTARARKAAALCLLLTTGLVSLTGCSALSAVGISAPSPSQTTVAGIDPSTVTVQPEFKQHFGQQNAVPVATVGLRLLEVAIKDHPEFTLSTFKQTKENWDKEVAPKLRGIESDAVFSHDADKWAAGQKSVVSTNVIGTDAKGRTTAPDGSICTLSSTRPFDYVIEKPEVAGSGPAEFNAPVKWTVHCKEGTSVKATLKFHTELTKQGANPWQVTDWNTSLIGQMTTVK